MEFSFYFLKCKNSLKLLDEQLKSGTSGKDQPEINICNSKSLVKWYKKRGITIEKGVLKILAIPD